MTDRERIVTHGRPRLAARPRWSTGPRAPCGHPAGRPRVGFTFTVTGGRIVRVDLLADPERLARLELAELGD
jgi:hypothetical protein